MDSKDNLFVAEPNIGKVKKKYNITCNQNSTLKWPNDRDDFYIKYVTCIHTNKLNLLVHYDYNYNKTVFVTIVNGHDKERDRFSYKFLNVYYIISMHIIWEFFK